MRTHRFGRKILLPSTMAIKHQIRMLMAEDEARKAGAEAAAPTPSCVPAPSIRLTSPPAPASDWSIRPETRVRRAGPRSTV
jgi:hypothetical protein